MPYLLFQFVMIVVYCDAYRWYPVGLNDIVSTTTRGISSSYTADSNNNDFLKVTATATNTDCGEENNAKLITFINPTVVEEAIEFEEEEWKKIRYTQSFSGCASCWTIFGANSKRIPDPYGLMPYNSSFDTLIDYNLAKGSWNGETNVCNNLNSNHWHAMNGCGYKGSLRIELRRNFSSSDVGIGTGYGCAQRSLSFTYTFIEVGYANITTTTTTTTTTAITTIAPNDRDTYEMMTIDGFYKCTTLTDNIAFIIAISYDDCLSECLDLNECFMVNYILNGKTSSDFRCYLFDKKCDIMDDDNNNLLAIKMRTYDDICIDHPSDWSDIYDDECSYYDEYKWCKNVTISNNLTASHFMSFSDEYYGLNAIQTCCLCGGGLNIFNDVKLEYSVSFDNISGFNDSLLCTETYDENMSWNNMDFFDLCKKMKRKMYNKFEFILNPDNQTLEQIDCNIFIDDVLNVETDIILCDVDTYDHNDVYFISIFDIDSINETSAVYINSEWLNNTDAFIYTAQSYQQCIQSLSYTTHSTLFGIFPCNNNSISLSTADPITLSTADSIALSSTSHSITLSTADSIVLSTSDSVALSATDSLQYTTTTQGINSPQLNYTVDIIDSSQTNINSTTHVINSSQTNSTLNTNYAINSSQANSTTAANTINSSLTISMLDTMQRFTSIITTMLDSDISDVRNNANSNETIIQNVELLILSAIFTVALLAIMIGCGFYVKCKRKEDVSKINKMEKQIQSMHMQKRPQFTAKKERERDDECILCCDETANMVNYPCGHISYCSQCSITAMKNDSKCPICRELITYAAGFVTDDNGEQLAVTVC